MKYPQAIMKEKKTKKIMKQEKKPIMGSPQKESLSFFI